MPRIALRHLVAAMALSAGAATAHEFQIGALTIDHPHVPATAATARTGAGYLTIRNAGDTPDRLLGVEADVPRVGFHTTEVDAAGVARMVPVAAIEIPAGGSVELAPRGLHVMFMGLSEPLEEGARIDATLFFERAGAVAVQFAVEAPDAASDHEH